MSTRFLTHARVKLALHEIRAGEGTPLLLLHALGAQSPTEVPRESTWIGSTWRGPVFALDFSGHGASTRPRGGGYHPEILMGDADIALAELGTATLLGAGIGGYVAVMLAGGRPLEVRGAIVCDGAGLAGGGAEPSGPRIIAAPAANEGDPGPEAPDPFALVELMNDVRPPDYVSLFARVAAAQSGIAEPITVCATERPPWLVELLREPGVVEGTIAEAIATYSSPTIQP